MVGGNKVVKVKVVLKSPRARYNGQLVKNKRLGKAQPGQCKNV
jgi:hypothetical protein